MIISGSSYPAARVPAARIKTVLWRRRVTVAAVVALGLATALANYAMTAPRYSAQAVIALDARQLQALPNQAVISPLPNDSPALKTELDIIGSRLLAEQVYAQLQTQDVHLNPYTPAQGLLAAGTAIVRPLLGLTQPAPGTDLRRDTVAMLQSNLRVENDGRSLTIFINYTADDPQTAALVANTVAQAYLDHQVNVQIDAVERVRSWLALKVDGLRKDLTASETARANFRQQAGIVEFNGSTLQSHRVTALDQELVTVRTALVSAQARLATAQAQATDPNGIAFSEVLASPTIQAFRIEQARLQRAIDDLDNAGATKSEQLPGLKSQLATIEAQIGTETGRILSSLANEVAVQQVRETSLTTALAEAQNAMSQNDTSIVEAAELDRQASANREIYDAYLTRYKQTVEQDGITSPGAQILSQADVPATKSSPSLALALLVGLVGGGAAATAGAFARELTDRRIRSQAQLQGTTGIPVLGVVNSALVASMGRGRTEPSALNCSIAMPHAALRSNPDTRDAKIITVTAARPGEGKTLVAAGLAVAMAASRCRVLAIDLDDATSGLTKALAAYPSLAIATAINQPKLVEMVTDSAVTVLTLRDNAMSAELLTDGKNLGSLIEQIKAQFDIVLIDTPAAGERSVAMQAAALSDLTLLVVNTRRTRLGEVEATARSLPNQGVGTAALVINDFTTARPLPFQPTTPASAAGRLA